MYPKFIVIVFFLASLEALSQDSRITLELNYPYPLDNNFIGSQFSGIINIGAKYSFSENEPIRLGASFNSAVLMFKSNGNSMFTDFRITSYLLQPRIISELLLDELQDFRPFIGLGYTVMLIGVTGVHRQTDVSNADETRGGINVNLGSSIKMTHRLFAQVQYDFIKFGTADDLENNNFNTNVNLLKLGLGYRL